MVTRRLARHDRGGANAEGAQGNAYRAGEGMDPESLAKACHAERLATSEGLKLVRANNLTGFRGVSREGRRSGRDSFRVRCGNDDVGFYSSAAEGALAYARFIGPIESVKQVLAFERSGERSAYVLARRNTAASAAKEYRGFGVPLAKRLATHRDEHVQQTDTVECVAVSDEEAADDADAIVVAAVLAPVAGESSSSDEQSAAIPAHARLTLQHLPTLSTTPATTPTAPPATTSTATTPTAPPATFGVLRCKRTVQTLRAEYEAQLTMAETISIPVPPALRGRKATVVVSFSVDE